jgi:nitronate monooxygenase
VLLAAGIADSADTTAALAALADGAVAGTRFLLTHECRVHHEY